MKTNNCGLLRLAILGVLSLSGYGLTAHAAVNITNPFAPLVIDKTIYLKTISQGSAAGISNSLLEQTLFNDLTAPLSGKPIPGDTSGKILAVADQMGKLWLVNLADSSRTLLLDLAIQPQVKFPILSKVYDERGFWGLEFDPNFAENGVFYTYNSDLYCTVSGPSCISTPIPGTFKMPPITPFTAFGLPVRPNHQTVLRMWKVNPQDLLNFSPSITPIFQHEIFRIDKPQSNHNAGVMAFGPDKMLYISVGDGGGAADYGPGHLALGPNNIGGGNAQSLAVIYGKILRINPNPEVPLKSTEVLSANGMYSIPTDNPFFPIIKKENGNIIVGGQTGCDDINGKGCSEIYAYGFRNPYSMSFDKQKGHLFIGDVGQHNIEEVNIIDKSQGGGNYGWNIREGSYCFNVGYPYPAPPVFSVPNTWLNDPSECAAAVPPTGLIDPVAQYDQSEGISVIGGFVYRNNKENDPGLKKMEGQYIFGDYKKPGFFTFIDGRLMYLVNKNMARKDISEIRGFNIVDDVPRPIFLDISGNPIETKMLIYGFAEDNDGNIYVLGKWATRSVGSSNPNLGPRGNLGFIKKIIKIEDNL